VSIETGIHYPLNLNDLPDGWRAAYFGEFTERIEPGFASGEHNQTGSGIPHLRPMNIDRGGRIDFSLVKSVDATKDKRRLAVGDVIFNNTNSPELVGKTAVISQSGEFAFSNHMTRIQLKDSVLPKFAALQFHLLWMRGYFKYNCVKHVNQASISSKTLAQSVPFIWAPLEQQENIVAELEKQFSRLDEAVANLRRVKANLKRYKASVLKAAVEGRLVETEASLARREGRTYETGEQLLQRILEERRARWAGRGKYKELVAPDEEGLHTLPEGWAWCACDQISEKITDGEHISPNTVAHGVPLLSAKDVLDTGVTFDDAKFVAAVDSEKFRSRCNPDRGDVLIVSRGATIGRACLVNSDQEFCLMGSVILMKPHAGVNSAYLLQALKAGFFQTRLTAVSGSTAQQAIYIRDIRPLQMPLPPQAEQARIVAEVDRHLSIIREVEAEVDTNLQRAQALRQATLAKAFSSTLV